MAGLVAVTGATGFLGRYIVRSLAQQGWRVRILARGYPVHEQFSDIDFEVVAGDLSNHRALQAFVRGATCVVHAAGLIKARHANAFQRVNVQGTENLVAAINVNDAPARLVMVSSMAAREPHLSPYAASKRAAEEIARNRLEQRHEWTIIRPCAIYGPWDVETLMVLRAVSLGVALQPGGRQARVSLMHAADAAAAVASLCAHPQPGHVYEITDARQAGYLWREITDAAAEALHIRAIPLPLPAMMVRIIGRIGTIAGHFSASPAMITMDKVREILHPDWSSASSRQPPLHLWQPEIDINCGFLETIQWYQSRGWLPEAVKMARRIDGA